MTKNREQTISLSNQVLEKIDSMKLSRTPENYEVWYVYFSGSHPEMVRALDVLLKNKQPINDQRCFELHERFLTTAQPEEVMQSTSTKMSETIDKVTSMVKDLQKNASAYNTSLKGASSEMEKATDVNSLRKLVDNLSKQTQEALERNQKLEQQLEQSSETMNNMKRDLDAVRKEALTDGLTGIPNRKAFDKTLYDLQQHATYEGGTFSLLLLDIDHFKSFNDTHGHQVGDQVLRLVARTLKDGIKGQDIAARYGGEEFAVLLPQTNLNGAEIVSENLRKAIAAKDLVNRSTGESLGRITISIGVAQYTTGETNDSVIGRADDALYKAKDKGRNCVVLSE